MELIEQDGSKGKMIVTKGMAKTSCIGVNIASSSSMNLEERNLNQEFDKVCATPKNCTSESAWELLTRYANIVDETRASAVRILCGTSNPTMSMFERVQRRLEKKSSLIVAH